MTLLRLLRIASILALSALAQVSSHAADLEVGGGGELWFDDNVYGSSRGEISDFEFLLSPTAKLSERWGSLSASLKYRPTYEFFIDETSLSGWNHLATADLEWNLSPRTSVVLDEDFTRYRSLRLFGSGGAPGPTGAEFDAREKFLRNNIGATLRHRLTRTQQLMFQVSHGIWNFEEPTRSDQQSFSVASQYLQNLNPVVSLGGSASVSRVEIDKSLVRPDSDTNYYNASFILNYQPAPNYFARFSLGPTFVQRERQKNFLRGQRMRLIGGANPGFEAFVVGTCPAHPSGGFFNDGTCTAITFPFVNLLQLGTVLPFRGGRPGRTDFTYFADMSFTRTWEAFTAEISYRRDEGTASAVGFSTISDTFDLRGTWRLSDRMNFVAAGIWENRTESQDAEFVTILDTIVSVGNLVPVAVSVEDIASSPESVESATVMFSLNFQVQRRTLLRAVFSWREQLATRDSNYNDFERYLVILGATYAFEPFRW